MSKGTIILSVVGLAVVGLIAYLVLRAKPGETPESRADKSPPPVSGASTGVASGSGVKHAAPPQSKGYGDKWLATAGNLLNVTAQGVEIYKNVWGQPAVKG